MYMYVFNGSESAASSFQKSGRVMVVVGLCGIPLILQAGFRQERATEQIVKT